MSLVSTLEHAVSLAREAERGHTYTQSDLNEKVAHYYEKGRVDGNSGTGPVLFLAGAVVGAIGAALMGAFV